VKGQLSRLCAFSCRALCGDLERKGETAATLLICAGKLDRCALLDVSSGDLATCGGAGVNDKSAEATKRPDVVEKFVASLISSARFWLL